MLFSKKQNAIYILVSFWRHTRTVNQTLNAINYTGQCCIHNADIYTAINAWLTMANGIHGLSKVISNHKHGAPSPLTMAGMQWRPPSFAQIWEVVTQIWPDISTSIHTLAHDIGLCKFVSLWPHSVSVKILSQLFESATSTWWQFL